MAKAKHYVTLREILAAKPCADGRRMAKRLCKLHGFGMDTPIPLSRIAEEVHTRHAAWAIAAMPDQAPARRLAADIAQKASGDEILPEMMKELRAGVVGEQCDELLYDARYLNLTPTGHLQVDAIMYCCVTRALLRRSDYLGNLFIRCTDSGVNVVAAIKKHLS